MVMKRIGLSFGRYHVSRWSLQIFLRSFIVGAIASNREYLFNMKARSIYFVAAILAVLSSAAPVRADDPAVVVELNKLETQGKGCRVFVLIANKSDTPYQALKLDLILFKPDGVIERRLLLDLAPLRAAKTSVKTFDLDALECSGISSILINDAIECRSDASAIPDCLDRVSASSRSSVKFSK